MQVSRIILYNIYIEILLNKYNIVMYKLFYRYTRRSHKQYTSLEKAIEMCIKSLPDELQKKYQDFSLFVHDLNIKPEVI